MPVRKKPSANIVGKGKNAGDPHCFLSSYTNSIIYASFKLSSANVLNLDKSTFLLHFKEYNKENGAANNSLPNNKFFYLVQMKEFADDNLKFNGNFCKTVENTVGNVENCLLPVTFPFPNVFKRLVQQTCTKWVETNPITS